MNTRESNARGWLVVRNALAWLVLASDLCCSSSEPHRVATSEQHGRCYTLAYSGWLPRDSGVDAPDASSAPARIELGTSARRVSDVAHHAYAVFAVPRHHESTRYMGSDSLSYWMQLTPDSLVITWDPSTLVGGIAVGGQAALRVRRRGERLNGRIEIYPDAALPFGYPRATVVGEQIPCIRTRRGEAWSAAGRSTREITQRLSPDTAAAIREIAAEWEALREQNRAVNATVLIGLLRQFYTRHRVFPPHLAALFPTGDVILDRLPRRALLTDSWGHPFRYSARGTSHFDLTSGGADGRFDTVDDTAWTNIVAVVAEPSVKRPTQKPTSATAAHRQ